MSDRVVWKYAIPIGDGAFELGLPKGAEFASLGVIDGQPFLWFVVNPEMQVEQRQFFVRDTGQALREADVGMPLHHLRFIGTVIDHLFADGIINVRHVWGRR